AVDEGGEVGDAGRASLAGDAHRDLPDESGPWVDARGGDGFRRLARREVAGTEGVEADGGNDRRAFERQQVVQLQLYVCHARGRLHQAPAVDQGGGGKLAHDHRGLEVELAVCVLPERTAEGEEEKAAAALEAAVGGGE